MRKFGLAIIVWLVLLVGARGNVWANDLYTKAVVEQVENLTSSGEDENPLRQRVGLRLLEGELADQRMEIIHGEMVSLSEEQLVKVGDTVVTMRIASGDYLIIDFYRIPQIRNLLIVFFVFVVIFAGRKGLGSLVGMMISLVVIVKFMVPSILSGSDPLMVSLSGALLILVATLYLAHGFSRQTTVSLVSTLVVLLMVGVFSWVAVETSRLTGMGSDDAAGLRIGATEVINLKGLLLGSMIIGVIGVLDDITTAQVAAVFELKKANKQLSFKELWRRGRNIGTEHIASLVNTLVMAYAGAAMPVFIFLVLNPSNEPFWMMFNSELISEEIVRTLTGSMGLVLAVPITTLLAAWYASRFALGKVELHGHKH